ncbi:MAG: lytic transglycosylase domain-containing protein [Calothrix sp. SM1_5_4]|nr:lytic transglycosylase domain-containing protein [Calothrix sp. SM1_5_4]
MAKAGGEGRRPDSVAEPKVSLSELQRQVRLAHAQELLGKHYEKSVVRRGERIDRINRKIYMFAKERLPRKHRHKYKAVAQAIIDESVKYQFDPVFLLSVIQGESSFNPDRLGGLDEIGLMQIRPATGEWIAKKYGLPWKDSKTLFDPIANIRLGAAFLHHLRERFDSHAQLYLAAYNMGARNVNEAVGKNVWPKDYPNHVMKLYVEFYSNLDVPAKRDRG